MKPMNKKRKTLWYKHREYVHDEVMRMVKKANNGLEPERQVPFAIALEVANRALKKNRNPYSAARAFAALRAVSSFISMATSGKETIGAAENFDLLPVGHPLSTRPNAMTASALQHARARWLAADPAVDDSVRPLIASAHAAEPGSVERTYMFERLAAVATDMAPLWLRLDDPRTMFGPLSFIGGNSSAARRARAQLQRRDRRGRFAEMGGGFTFNIRGLDGVVSGLSGRVVGASGSDLVEVEVKGNPSVEDGIYALKAGKGLASKAILSPSAVDNLPDREAIAPAKFVIDSSTLRRMDAPTGWKKVDTDPDAPSVWVSDDGYFVTKDGDNFTLNRATEKRDRDRSENPLDEIGEEVATADNWADMVKAAADDQEEFGKILDEVEKKGFSEDSRKAQAKKDRAIRQIESDDIIDEAEDRLRTEPLTRTGPWVSRQRYAKDIDAERIGIAEEIEQEIADKAGISADELKEILSGKPEAPKKKDPTKNVSTDEKNQVLIDWAAQQDGDFYKSIVSQHKTRFGKLTQKQWDSLEKGFNKSSDRESFDGRPKGMTDEQRDQLIKDLVDAPFFTGRSAVYTDDYVDNDTSAPSLVRSVEGLLKKYDSGEYIKTSEWKRAMDVLEETKKLQETNPEKFGDLVSPKIKRQDGETSAKETADKYTNFAWDAVDKIAPGSSLNKFRLKEARHNLDIAQGVLDAVDASDDDRVEVDNLREAVEFLEVAAESAPSLEETPEAPKAQDVINIPGGGTVGEARKFVEDAIKNGQMLRFEYGGKERVVKPVRFWINGQTGRVNLNADDNGVNKNFSYDKMKLYPEADVPESPGEGGEIKNIDVTGDVEAQLTDAIESGGKVRFNYNNKDRVFAPERIYTNPKTGKKNVVGMSETDGEERTFTLDNFQAPGEVSAPEAAPEVAPARFTEVDVVGSTALEKMTYDPNTKELFVEFKSLKGKGGGKYVYEGVGQDVVDEFISAESKGKLIPQLKRDHDVRKLDDTEAQRWLDALTEAPGAPEGPPTSGTPDTEPGTPSPGIPDSEAEKAAKNIFDDIVKSFGDERPTLKEVLDIVDQYAENEGLDKDQTLIDDIVDRVENMLDDAELARYPEEPTNQLPDFLETEFDEMFDTPDGAYKPNIFDMHTPLGRTDQESSDYTDDPSVLASKFSQEELAAALRDAVLPSADGPADGRGALEFDQGDELVPAEAVYEALQLSGIDPDMILAGVYDSALDPDRDGGTNIEKLRDRRDQIVSPAGEEPELVPMTDRGKQVEEAIKRNEAVATPTRAQRGVDLMNDYVEENEALRSIATRLKELQDTDDFYDDEGLQNLLEDYLPLSISGEESEREAFRGLWGLLMSLDGGASNDAPSDEELAEMGFRGRVMRALQLVYPGEVDQEVYDDLYNELIGQYGGYPEFVNGRDAIADGVDDLDSPTTAAAFYRLTKEAARPTTVEVQRSIGIRPDDPLLLTYTTPGSVFAMDPRSFTTNNLADAKGLEALQFAPGTDFSHVIFRVAPGDADTFSAISFSWFPGEQEHIGWGMYEVASVRTLENPLRKNQAKVEVTIRKTDKQPAAPTEESIFEDTTTDVSNWTKVGDQAGSNAGGFFEDEDGNQYYVKVPKSQKHAENEVLAAKFYERLGVPAAEVRLGEDNGETRIVSPLIPGATSDLSDRLGDKIYLEKLRDGFVVDAWLANWDVAGLVYDNVMTDEDGNPVRVDPGGALMYRARGAEKGQAFGDVVGELDTLRDPDLNRQNSKIFSGITDGELAEQARRLRRLDPEEIDAIVDSTVTDPEMAATLKQRLRARRQNIIDRLLGDEEVDEISTGRAPAPVAFATKDLEAGDVTTTDSFTIESIFVDENTPKGKMSVQGYFPGHESQRKEWNPETQIEVVRGGVTPPKGDKPALHRPTPPRKPSDGAFTGEMLEKLRGATSWEDAARIIRDTEIVFFDYETTGLPDRDKPEVVELNRPVQIGAVKVRNGEIIDRFNLYMNPDFRLSDWSRSNLKREDGELLTDEWLAEQPSMAEAHRQFIDWVGGPAILGGQYVPFDREVLERTLREQGLEFEILGTIDTKDIAAGTLPRWSSKSPDGPFAVGADGKRRASNSLGPIATYLGIEPENWHRADADAALAASVLDSMLDRAISNPETSTEMLDADTIERQQAARAKFEADLEQYKVDKANYEAAKAVAAAWNCGGGLTAAGKVGPCNVPSVDTLINNAQVSDSELVDPDGVPGGATDSPTSMADTGVETPEADGVDVTEGQGAAAPAGALLSEFGEVDASLQVLQEDEDLKPSVKKKAQEIADKVKSVRDRLNSGELTEEEALGELNDLISSTDRTNIDIDFMISAVEGVRNVLDGSAFVEKLDPNLPPPGAVHPKTGKPVGFAKDGVTKVVPGMLVRDKDGFAGTVDRYNKSDWVGVYVINAIDGQKYMKASNQLTPINPGDDDRAYVEPPGGYSGQAKMRTIVPDGTVETPFSGWNDKARTKHEEAFGPRQESAEVPKAEAPSGAPEAAETQEGSGGENLDDAIVITEQGPAGRLTEEQLAAVSNAKPVKDPGKFLSKLDKNYWDKPNKLKNFFIKEEEKTYTEQAKSQHDIDGAIYYMQGGAEEYNRWLAGLPLPENARKRTEEKYIQVIKTLDKIIKLSPKVNEDIVVYRGVRARAGDQVLVQRLGQLLPGDEFTSPTFTSTSIIRSVAEQFSGKNGVFLEIVVPKGSSGLFVDPIMSGGEEYEDTYNLPLGELAEQIEAEFVLPRNMTFKVISRDGNNIKLLAVEGEYEEPRAGVPEQASEPENLPEELGDEITAPSEEQNELANRVPPDETLLKLLKTGSTDKGVDLNESWADYMESATPSDEEVKITRSMSDFLASLDGERIDFDDEFTIKKLLVRKLLTVVSEEDVPPVDKYFSGSLGYLAWAVHAWTSGMYADKSPEEAIKAMEGWTLDRLSDQGYLSPAWLTGGPPKGMASLREFWETYARILENPSLIEPGVDPEVASSPAGILMRTLKNARKLDGTYARVLHFEQDINDPSHPLNYMLEPGQQVTMRPSSWAKVDPDDPLDDTFRYGKFAAETGAKGDVMILVEGPNGIDIRPLANMYGENEFIVSNGKYKVVSVEQKNVEDSDITYTEIRLSTDIAGEDESKKAKYENFDAMPKGLQANIETVMTDLLNLQSHIGAVFANKAKLYVPTQDGNKRFSRAPDAETPETMINTLMSSLASGTSQISSIPDWLTAIESRYDAFYFSNRNELTPVKIRSGGVSHAIAQVKETIKNMLESDANFASIKDDMYELDASTIGFNYGTSSGDFKMLKSAEYPGVLEFGAIFAKLGGDEFNIDELGVANPYKHTSSTMAKAIMDSNMATTFANHIYARILIEKGEMEDTGAVASIEQIIETYKDISYLADVDTYLPAYGYDSAYVLKEMKNMVAGLAEMSEAARQRIKEVFMPEYDSRAGRPVNEQNVERLSWEESGFDAVLSMSAALAASQAGKGRVYRTLVDSSDIEDHLVEVITAQAPYRFKENPFNIRHATRISFKLTGWRNEGLANVLELVGAPGFTKNNYVEIPSLFAEKANDPDSMFTTHSVATSSQRGRTYSFFNTIDGVLTAINFVNIDEKSRNSDGKVDGRAFNGLVDITVPEGTDISIIEKAMNMVGVRNPRPATREDAQLLIENRIISVFGGFTDASTNINDPAERKRLLAVARAQYGVTPDSVEFVSQADNTVRMLTSEDAGKSIAAATSVRYFMHEMNTQNDTRVRELPSDERPEMISTIIADMFTTDSGTGGALLPTSQRYYRGLHFITGQSPEDDMDTGGADYSFATPLDRETGEYNIKDGVAGSPIAIIYDAEKMFRRLDFYSNTYDRYGARNDFSEVLDTTRPGAHETIFKGGIGPEAIVKISVRNKELRDMIIEKLRARGVEEINEIPIDELFFAPSDPSGDF